MKGAAFCFLALVGCGTDTFVIPDAGDAGGEDVVVGDAGPTCAPNQKLCGAACVDTSSDVAHCGDCNTACAVLDAGAAACMGGTCVYPMLDSACVALNGNDVFWTNGRGPESGAVYRVGHGLDGGAPKLIADGQTFPHGIAADDNQVYWGDIGLLADHGSVHRAATDGTKAALVADSSSGVFMPGPVIAADGEVFWGNDNAEIWQASTSGGAAKLVTTASGVPLFFVATTTAIYWSSNPISLSAPPTIGQYTFGAPGGMDVYTGQPGQVFGAPWVATDDDAVCLARTAEQSVDCGLLAVQGPDIAFAKNTPAYDLTATADQTKLYWTEHVANGRIMRGDEATNMTSMLAQDDQPTCLAIDGQFVYWTARGRVVPGVATR